MKSIGGNEPLPNGSPLRVLIVARYASVRAGLASMLEDQEFKIVGEISGAADLEETFASSPADVVLCDSEAEEIRDLIQAAAHRDCSLVILDGDIELASALAIASLTGWALLPKDAEREELRAALRAAASGLVSFDRTAALTLLKPPLVHAATATADTETLTAREKEILQLMAEGLPNKQIGVRLSISLHTVKFHVASILAKLAVQSRTEAVTLGVRRGLVTL